MKKTYLRFLLLASSLLVVTIFTTCVLVPVVLATPLLEKAKSDYQYQLDEYRQEYDDFDAKRTQYNSIHTFASQEELVLAAKIVMLRRVGVWRAYLQMLKVELIEAKGIDEVTRQRLINTFESWEIALDDHSERISNLETRDELVGESIYLNNQKNGLTLDTYVGLAHIKLAQLQHLLDGQRTLANEIVNQVQIQIKDTVTQESRLRGFEQVKEIHQLVQNQLALVDAQVEKLELSTSDPVNDYDEIITGLAPTYQQLNQSYAYIKELAKGLE